MNQKKGIKKNLLNYILQQKSSLLISLLFVLLTAILVPLKSFIFQWLIESRAKDEVVMNLGIGIVIVVASNVCEFIARNVFSKMSAKASECVRIELTSILQSIPLSIFEADVNSNKSKWLASLTNETRIVEEDYYNGLFDMTIWICIGLSAVVYMSTISTVLLIVALGLASLPFFVPSLLAPYLSRAKENNTQAFNHLFIKVKELIDGYETLITNNNRLYMKETIKGEANLVSKTQFEMKKVSNVSSSITALVSWLPGFTLLVAGAFLVLDGKISLGYLITANTLINFILIPFRQVANAYISVQSTSAIRKKLNRMLQEESITGKKTLCGNITEITISNLSFNYPNNCEVVLKDIGLTLAGREKIAIVGNSGGGKSTLLKIMAKFFSSYMGEVEISGGDIRDFDDNAYFERVAYISQNPFIFEDTLLNNICLGGCFLEEDIKQAVELSGLVSLVDSLPNGLSTFISEGGNDISVGQKKRIAIARSLIRKCEVLLVDEVTSSLDIETTNEIVKNLISLPCAVVLVTHDVFESYMDEFDRIYCIAAGRISEVGTYAELLERKGQLYQAVKAMRKGGMAD